VASVVGHDNVALVWFDSDAVGVVDRVTNPDGIDHLGRPPLEQVVAVDSELSAFKAPKVEAIQGAQTDPEREINAHGHNP